MMKFGRFYSIAINQAGVGTDTASGDKPGYDERIVLVSSSLYIFAAQPLELCGLSVSGPTGDHTLVYLPPFDANQYLSDVKQWMLVLPQNSNLVLSATLGNAGSYAVGTAVYAKVKESDLVASGVPLMDAAAAVEPAPVKTWLDNFLKGWS